MGNFIILYLVLLCSLRYSLLEIWGYFDEVTLKTLTGNKITSLGCVLKEEDDIIVLQTAPAVNNPAPAVNNPAATRNQYCNKKSTFLESLSPLLDGTSTSRTPNSNNVQFRK